MIANLPTEAAEQSLDFTFNKEILSFSGYDTQILASRNSFDDENEYIGALNDLIIDSTPVQYVLAASMGAAVMTALKFCYNMDRGYGWFRFKAY